MLCHNIDTNAGLVNGAIGTMASVEWNHITVQFDHTNHTTWKRSPLLDVSTYSVRENS